MSVFIHAFESNRNIYSTYCILKVIYRGNKRINAHRWLDEGGKVNGSSHAAGH